MVIFCLQLSFLNLAHPKHLLRPGVLKTDNLPHLLEVVEIIVEFAILRVQGLHIVDPVTSIVVHH